MPKVDIEYKMGPNRPEWSCGDTMDYTNGAEAIQRVSKVWVCKK